ncbi:HipA family kinase [[Mycoplasma] anseris]|uniref:HipA-like kinase domain-containing protein n=1 Tax=[Mycoplasma] anseris TaxID=92400 RepID=A0A2Z4NCL2_9BACT|nr:HipA family kinase [[Mycoplasma] anseris]AWX69303.1 hypothetical protein DP065_00840 [[Mycoplasma] anseris]
MFKIKIRDKDCFSFFIKEDSQEFYDWKILNPKLEEFVNKFQISPSNLIKYILIDRKFPEKRYSFSAKWDFYKFSNFLNLSDNFWITNDSNKKFIDVNLFDTFKNEQIDFIEKEPFKKQENPAFFTNGNLKKCWFIKENQQFLVKQNSNSINSKSMLESYSEFFSSQLAKHLGLDSVEYDLIKFQKNTLSICRNFANKDASYLPLSVFVKETEKVNQKLLNKLEKIIGKNFFEDLMLFDALICNTDRHLGNLGILIDEEFNVIKNAPIFDNGNSLFFDINIYDDNMIETYINNYGKNKAKLFKTLDDQMKYYLRPRHVIWINKLKKFKFKQHSHCKLKSSIFKRIQKEFKQRVSFLESLYKEKFNKDKE